MPKYLNDIEKTIENLKVQIEEEKSRLREIPNKDRNWTPYLKLYKQLKYRQDLKYREYTKQYNKEHQSTLIKTTFEALTAH